MKNHVWRPLFVVLAIVAVILLARAVYVPKDFGIHGGEGFMYGWYREGNVQDWKDFPAKYRGQDYCAGCHTDQADAIGSSMHSAIQCENCHGPALDHPENPEKLTIERGRDLCVRCHAYLPYSGSDRAKIAGIEPDDHNPGMACVDCHTPHHPDL